MRLYFIVLEAASDTQEISRFLVEILNHAVRLKERQTKRLSSNQQDLARLSLKNLSLIDENVNKNYKYLLKQSLDRFLDG